MKWFRHFSDESDWPEVKRLFREFGSDGYYVYFRTFEIIAWHGDKYFRLSFRKYSKSEISSDFGLPQERVEKIWTCMMDEDVLDTAFYERGILYSRKLKERADFYTKYLKTTKKKLKRNLKENKATEVEAEVKTEVEVEEEGEAATARIADEKVAAVAIQKIIGQDISLDSIQKLIRGKDLKQMVALAKKAKQKASSNPAGYFRKLVEEKATVPKKIQQTGDFWLDVTPDQVVALVRQKLPDSDMATIKHILMEIHTRYNEKHEPAEFHKWKWDMRNSEVENMLQIAKQILNREAKK